MLAAGHATRAAECFVDYWSGDGAFARLSPNRQRALSQCMPSIAQHFDALQAPLPADRQTGLDMPVLCLTGSASTAACRRIDKLLRALLPDAQHETLDGMGHMAPITHAAQVNQRLLHFIGRCRHLVVQPPRARSWPALGPHLALNPS
jgi:pimeloyl-ACP methyl ester carboxylesterase